MTDSLRRSDDDEDAQFQVREYDASTPRGHPETHKYISTFHSRRPDSPNQIEENPYQAP